MSGINFGTNVEEQEERVAGWEADPSYSACVIATAMYITESRKGSLAFNLEVETKDGKKRAFTTYFTNQQKEVFYTKNGKSLMLPGFQLLNNLCLATCGKSFQEIQAAPRKVTITQRDFESRKDISVEVDSYPQVLKKAFHIGVIKTIQNGFAKGKPTNDKRTGNEIHMVFTKDKRTISELNDNVSPEKATKFKEWNDYWIGRERNTFKEVAEEKGEESSGSDPFNSTSDTSDDDVFGDSSGSDKDTSGDAGFGEDTSSESTTDSQPSGTVSEEEDPFA